MKSSFSYEIVQTIYIKQKFQSINKKESQYTYRNKDFILHWILESFTREKESEGSLFCTSTYCIYIIYFYIKRRIIKIHKHDFIENIFFLIINDKHIQFHKTTFFHVMYIWIFFQYCDSTTTFDISTIKFLN